MRCIFSVLVFVVLGVNTAAQDLPKPMVPFRLVNDFTGLLTEQEQITLNNKLLQFNNETTTQIYVVTYDELQGYDIADFGARLGEEWGIGQQGKNNGLLVLVSPSARKITIQTGYGLEGAVPDAIAVRLINNIITPGFQRGQYYASLDSTTNVLMSLTRGEYTAENYMKGSKEETPGVIFGLFMLVAFFFMFISRSRKNRAYSPKHNIPWWLFLLGAGSSKGSGWGSFSSGRGSFGGGGFGGFGGGGGGGFGGGGASGGW